MKNTYVYEQTHYDGSQPIYLWNFGSDSSGHLIYCNWHKEIEFVYVNEGSLCLYIDEKPITLQKGEIGIVNSNRMHYGHPASEAFCDITVMLFDLQQLLSVEKGMNEKHLKALAQNELWFPSHITMDMPSYPTITDIMDKITVCWERKPSAYELKMKSLLFDLLFVFSGTEHLLVHEHEWGTPKTLEKKEKLMKLTGFLEIHYPEKLSVSQLADIVYMGTDAFYKFMVSMTGTSPVTFTNQFRLRKAAELLQETNYSVTEICFQTGFSNVSYFIRCFNEFYGCTPGKYR